MIPEHTRGIDRRNANQDGHERQCNSSLSGDEYFDLAHLKHSLYNIFATLPLN